MWPGEHISSRMSNCCPATTVSLTINTGSFEVIMKLSQLASLLLGATTSFVQAQNGSFVSFSDPGIELDIKLAIPDTTAAPFPLLVTFSAPISVGWAGFATGGCMLRSPLIVAWPNGNSVLVTTRWATSVSLRFTTVRTVTSDTYPAPLAVHSTPQRHT